MTEEQKTDANQLFNNASEPQATPIELNFETKDILFDFDKIGPFIKRETNDDVSFIPVMCFRIYDESPLTSEERQDTNVSEVFFLNRNTDIYEPILLDDRFVFPTPEHGNSNADFLYAVNEGSLIQSQNGELAIISKNANDEDRKNFINGTPHSRESIIPVTITEYSYKELFKNNTIPHYQSGLEDTPPAPSQ